MALWIKLNIKHTYIYDIHIFILYMLQDIFKIGLKTARSPENCHNAYIYDPEICIFINIF